jgi:hypothetical protein
MCCGVSSRLWLIILLNILLTGRDDDSDAESEEPMSPAEVRMVQAMGKLEKINIDMRLLQVGRRKDLIDIDVRL